MLNVLPLASLLLKQRPSAVCNTSKLSKSSRYIIYLHEVAVQCLDGVKVMGILQGPLPQLSNLNSLLDQCSSQVLILLVELGYYCSTGRGSREVEGVPHRSCTRHIGIWSSRDIRRSA